MEFVLQVLGEFILQVVVEALVEIGFHSIAEPFRRPPNPWLAAFGYVILGAALGGLSLLVIAAHITPAGAWRFANLMLTPVAVGAGMAALGVWRRRRGEPVLRIDRFAYGYLFALAFALVRFNFAV